MSEVSPLYKRVSDAGLDNTSYWMSELAELGIQTLSSLRLIEGNGNIYHYLEEKAKFFVEKLALKELLKMNQPMIASVPSKKSESEILLHKISTWDTQKDPSEKEVEERLEYIVKAKKIIQTESPDGTAWIDILSNKKLQKFFTKILQDDLESPNIRLLMEEIIDQIDETSITEQALFIIKSVSSWLRDSFDTKTISDLSSFDIFLQKILANQKFLKKSKFSNLKTSRALGKHISEALYCLRHYYKKSYEDVFILIIINPFLKDSFNDVITLKPLLMKDLDSMQKIYSEQKEIFDVYRTKSNILLQAYLLLLAFGVCANSQAQAEKLFIKQTYYTMLDLPIELCHSISNIIKTYFEGVSSKIVAKQLKDLIYPPCQGREKKMALIQANHMIDQLRLLAYKEDDFFPLQRDHEAHMLLERLEMCKYYPKKLRLGNALCFDQKSLQLSLNEVSVTDSNQLPFLIIHKLMSYDCQCRSNLLPAVQALHYENESESEENEDDNEKSTLHSSWEVENGIYPLDCILAILLCSDDFLIQDLLTRLAKCQLAVPLILPDPFQKKLYLPLWAMCSIIKEWKSIENNNIISHVSPIISHPMPVITFIRIGKHCRTSLSKSKILNDVISDAHHDYFFHRDCPGGQYSTILGKGLVDMSWYLPSGKQTDSFSNAITFLNLHGDAREYIEQCSFLSEVSSMCIAFFTEDNPHLDDQMITCLNRFVMAPGGMLILNCNEKPLKGLKRLLLKVEIYNLMNKQFTKTAGEIKEAIHTKIKVKLSEVKSFQCIEDLCHQAKTVSMELDENSEAYQMGLLHSTRIINMISDEQSEKGVKDVMLPLQGEHLWKAWAYYEKELHRQIKKGNESIYEYSAKIELEKNKIRNKQLEHVRTLTPVMKLFIESLIELGKDDFKGLRNYFLQCLKLELNSLSRDNISQKQYEYQSIRKKKSKLQAENPSQKPEIKSEIAKLQNELEVLQEDIINSSLGLEHLLRELSQIYEAALDSKKRSENISSLDPYIFSLPKIAAELLIDGYPLEIMDGDAAHVPLQWVTAVIKEAVILLDDPNVFVLSVLGLQSTGKSTMLNTVFGLQFNVSAGRCTRGAFMQLLPLDKDLQTKTKCSYVIIVDTEGLRAPELDPTKTQNHDNELATFVIGLANMTLINIYGEVPGDIDDILQTSVHAFLRMSRVKYYPSCQFVHQNAGVNIKGEVSRAKFTQKLNKFTIDAAREEHFEGQFETFNDVIKFDDQTDVHYFPGLWKGDPPMAPVNQGYSHTAQSLKMQLIQNICKRASLQPTSEVGKLGDLNLSSFYVKIGDLWETLLKEKFVFSFKNTLEIKAYNALETAYYTWGWRFKSAMLEWEQKAENEIIAEPYESLTAKVEQKLRELREYVSETQYEPLRKEMEEFFNGKQSEILVQWKAKFEIRLESLSRELQSHAEDHCNDLLKNKQAIYGFETDRQKSVDFIKKKVQEHIEMVKKEQENLQESLERKELTSKQLKTLLARDLLNLKQLSQLEEDRVLTANQVIRIKSIISEDGLNEKSLKVILERELAIPEVKKILKRTQQTEDELKQKFDKIWDELIKQLPTIKSSKLSVIYEVEQALYSFVESHKGYHGQLIAKLKEKKLDMRGSDLEFKIERNRHFHPKYTVIEKVREVTRYFRGTSDQYEIEAIEVTKIVFDNAKQYLEATQSKNTAFNSTFVSELLGLVRDTIHSCSKHKDSTITFTGDYKLDIYITICSYSIPIFEVMARLFEERNDPKLYLEKHEKIPLFTKFKNQYKQTQAEEAIADTLCAYLEEPIRAQVGKFLGAKMVDKMTASNNYHFANKMALKVKILNDLWEADDFESYLLYIRDVKRFLEEKIKYYTIQYCNELVPDSQNTRLQHQAKEEVARLVEIIDTVVSYINKTDVKEWLITFCSDTTFRKELGRDIQPNDILGSYDALKELNLENFKERVHKALLELKARSQQLFDTVDCETEMANWKDKPHKILNVLVGCTEQCPFCKEQCDLAENHDCDHRTEVHRISCLAGWRNSATQEMTIDICPVLIDDKDRRFRKPDGDYHPYSDYKSVYTDWSIPPNRAPKSCTYWMWFVGRYKNELAEEYQAKASKIPKAWSAITWPEIKESLRNAYNIEL